MTFLNIEKNISQAKPLKCQLLKWVGNKQRYANEIISYFPKTYNRYFEPFIGSGAVLATIVPNNGLGSDNFPSLIEIWKTLKNDPELLKEWYEFRYNQIKHEGKIEVYNKVRVSYNNKPNGADLLFLSRSCYGGVVRFRKSDGYMSTPCGIHNPISSDSFNKRVDEWHSRVKNTEFELLDYKESMGLAKKNDLIYCDPPYSYSQGILYGAQEFKIDELMNEIDKCVSRGVYVALSIDGIKKSGTNICKMNIPPELFKREIFIDCGRSMLKRFQMEGQTLELEEVKDRLILTF